ncbi:Serine carboxypeptidase 3 [Cocos nucifera]|uniref:Carboxypeptidase n=1 Tax=Cocos nucifera TaxID=13894 RepID=A0A8K0IMB5_COCNU|nr:Serine carboxypeptidase 3 [Cocos nucifera]
MGNLSLALFFSALLLFSSFSPSSAAAAWIPDDLRLPSSATFPSAHAEKLIRALNLLPKDPSPEPAEAAADVPAKRIVERRFSLAGLTGGASVQDLGHYAGYYRLPHTHDARMFYLFFESRHSKKDPVVIWLTGGPGCSSELAVFYENGPFTIADNMTLAWNEFGWDQASNLLYVDQPTGTGFSYSTDSRDIRHDENGVSDDLYDFLQASNLLYVDQPTGTGFSYSTDSRDIRHDENGVSDDLYDFLQAFFAEHPEYVSNDFYITGESYAGHYIPAFASRIHQANKAKEGTCINLKGFAIGNGLTDPAIQYKAYTDFALDNGIIKESDYKKINKFYPVCEYAIKLCGTSGTISCLASYLVCNTIFNSIIKIAGNINYYDVRKQCEGSLCYDFSNMEKFLNLESVRDSLGVGDIEFVSCSPTVYQAMLMDWMRNLEVGIPALLEDGIKLLVYAGEYDLICNWLGNSRWVHSMEWSGQQNFTSSTELSFTVDGKEAGILKSHGPLSFLKVYDAGHMVPMDQPKAALEMLKRWIQGNLVEFSSESNSLNAEI